MSDEPTNSEKFVKSAKALASIEGVASLSIESPGEKTFTLDDNNRDRFVANCNRFLKEARAERRRKKKG
jgi:hypothetical protein